MEGKVAQIGKTGQLISDISKDQLADVPRDENTIIKFGDHETRGLFGNDHGQPDSTMVAFVGTSEHLEIEIVGISLSEMLGVSTGETVTITW